MKKAFFSGAEFDTNCSGDFFVFLLSLSAKRYKPHVSPISYNNAALSDFAWSIHDYGHEDSKFWPQTS